MKKSSFLKSHLIDYSRVYDFVIFSILYILNILTSKIKRRWKKYRSSFLAVSNYCTWCLVTRETVNDDVSPAEFIQIKEGHSIINLAITNFLKKRNRPSRRRRNHYLREHFTVRKFYKKSTGLIFISVDVGALPLGLFGSNSFQ